MKKLKKLSDIPAWFEISKYDKVSSLKLYEWYDQISKRQDLDNDIFLYMNNDIDEIRAWENLIKTNPIIENNDNLIQDRIIKEFGLGGVISDHAQESVSDFTVADYTSMNRAIDLMGLDEALENHSNHGTYNTEEWFKLNNLPVELLMYEKHWINMTRLALTVNLEASDEQLSADFTSWLKKARINFNSNATEKMFTSTDFEDWCEYAILPYYDLSTWARLNGSEFTSAIMSQAIFPNAGIAGFCGESRVRRETKKRSKEIFDYNAIRAMQAQVNKMAKN